VASRGKLRFGLNIERALITVDFGSFSDCKAACANASVPLNTH
jgi:hypothetical protein